MPIVRYAGVMAIYNKKKGDVRQAVQEAAEDLVSKAQAAAPVETGALRAGIHVAEVSESANSVEAKVATGGESEEYAIYQHEGTSQGVPATKFLERPLLDNREAYTEAMKRAWAGSF